MQAELSAGSQALAVYMGNLEACPEGERQGGTGTPGRMEGEREVAPNAEQSYGRRAGGRSEKMLL